MKHEYVDRAAIYRMLNDEYPFGWTNDDLADALSAHTKRSTQYLEDIFAIS